LALTDPCISRAINQTGADISNFKFAGIDNGLGTPIFNYEDPNGDSRYTDFTQTVPPAFIVQGQFYPISITNSFSSSSGNVLNKYVYIDLNRDNQFASNELVFVRTGVAAPTTANPVNAITTGTVSIADTARPGLTRMRVICSHTGINNACTPYNYGETEDYAVMIGIPFTNDLGAIGYYQPVGEICADQDAKIKMYIKNYGNTTQTFTENNQLILTATVTGAVGGTYTATVSNGSLAPDETMTVTIEHVNFATAGNYNITTTLSYAPDQYAVNNSTSIAVVVPTANVLQIPFTETFDVGTSDGSFPSCWTLSNSIPSYTWTIHSGLTPNAPNAGPEFDHTLGSTLGKYAYVGGRNNNNLSNYTTLTLACINLHYNNGYPIQLDFWKHVFGNNTAVFNMIIEVGTGDNFTPIDTLSEITQISNQASYDLHSVVFEGYDEVAKIKIKMTNHKGIVDPAIDDINIKYGRPDMGVAEIIYPVDFTEDGGCLVKKDSIRPVVKIQNFGLTPVTSFEIIGVLSIGNTFETHTEIWNGYLRAGESFEYQFENDFTIPRDGFYCQFQAKTNIDMDDNPLNNIKTVTACTEVDIESYEQQKGVVLGQNVPNPAYNNTRIPFLVPESGEASVKIYSPTGQLLYTESKQVNYGENYVDINVTQLANGIYFYTLYYKDVTLTKKMLIQR
ncbi:MAG: GEVED domain-containing protein, partial [Bacteroidales bacterium]